MPKKRSILLSEDLFSGNHMYLEVETRSFFFLELSIWYRQKTIILERSANYNTWHAILKYKAKIILKPAFGTPEIFWKDSPVLCLQQGWTFHKQLLEILYFLCFASHGWLASLVGCPDYEARLSWELHEYTLRSSQKENGLTPDAACLFG